MKILSDFSALALNPVGWKRTRDVEGGTLGLDENHFPTLEQNEVDVLDLTGDQQSSREEKLLATNPLLTKRVGRDQTGDPEIEANELNIAVVSLNDVAR